jgi:hypothetical protein
MIYAAPCIKFWMRAYPFEGKWEGVGPWNLRVFCSVADPDPDLGSGIRDPVPF